MLDSMNIVNKVPNMSDNKINAKMLITEIL